MADKNPAAGAAGRAPAADHPDKIRNVALVGPGGVGKTSVMTGLAEWFHENRIPVKLLDLDWVFQDGNGRRFIYMLAMTNHEELFQTKQVTTIIDLFWDKYQNQVFKKVFMPVIRLSG